jgi:membrane-anchored protein YejM (alkaline phosphatase superfamily)
LDQTHPFDASEERRMFAALERDRDRLLGAHLVAARRPSVVIVHVEALRRDMLREDVMPTLVRLSRTCLSPARHFSTSNNTASSMFGILNAMPVSYQRLALQDHAKSLPLQILKKLGYTRSAYYGAAIPSYHVLRDVFFDGVIDRIHEQQQAAADQGDAALVDEYVAEVARRDPAQPTFDYFVIESSHFPYSYPPAFEKLTPTVEPGVDVAVSDPREVGAKVRNRYMNAVSWVDSLIDRLARAWNARKGDVVLIVLGDHGESFWEHRAFGHGSSLYDQEVLVPFAMCIPGIDHTRYTYSSHTDIFPTLFDFMGLSGVDVPFRAGKSLLRYDATRDIAIVGYGVNGSEPDLRLGVEGKGLRVVYLNERPFTTISVARDDVELGAPLPADVEASVADLKLFAAAARALR